MPSPRASLESLPRLGWVEGPSPVHALPDRAARLGLGWLGVKRDDLLPALWGGTKVRKLDGLLACAPWREAGAWGAMGAIGSGHLVALAAAGERLDREVHAAWFWGEPTPHAVENMGFVATRAEIRYRSTRVGLALREPQAVLGWAGEIAWMPPGGSTPEGNVGLVFAGLELAQQVAEGLLPAPDHVVLALGSGGTTAGLALGLALGGLRPVVHAISVVERVSAPALRVGRIQRQLAAWLSARGLPMVEPAPIRIERGAFSARYGVPTPASLAAVAEMEALGLSAEPVYTGKAWAALSTLSARVPGQSVLFWETVRRDGLPIEQNWREALPEALVRRLDRASTALPGPSRRRLLVGGAALLAAAGGVARVSGYRAFPAWKGALLQAWEAEVLRRAAEAILPPAPLSAETLDAIPARADRFLASLSERGRMEIHGLFVLIEHGTVLNASAGRFSRLPVERRLDYLALLSSNSLGFLAAKGLRDLVLLGYYQAPESWPEIGYEGPWVPASRPPDPAWEALRAPPGTLPRSLA